MVLIMLLPIWPALVAPASAASVMGQVATGQVRVDGLSVPDGTTLLSPSTVVTGSEPALVYLENGQVLAMGPASTAYLETVQGSRVQATVHSGSLLVKRPTGRIMTVASNSVVLFDQEGAQQIGEGKRVAPEEEEMVELCRLVDWTPQKAELCHQDPDLYQCDWELIEVPPAEVEAHLAEGDVYPGRENNDLGLDEDCDEEEPVGWLAGVSNREKIIASVLGALTVAFWIDESDESPEERGASRVIP
jgi:hypothetical protein